MTTPPLLRRALEALLRRPHRDVGLGAVAAVLLVVALVATTCRAGVSPDPDPTPAVAAVRIGTGPALESHLLAAVAEQLLLDAGVTAEVVSFDEEADARRALEFGEVQFLPGYTGAAWLEQLGRADPPADVSVSYRRVRQLDTTNGVVWLPPAIETPTAVDRPPANATFAFVVAAQASVDADLVTISQLATRLASDETGALCVDPEFATRRDGLESFLRAYAIRFDVDIRSAGPEEVAAAVADGQCVAGLTTATDGRAWLGGLRPLRDDLGVFPAFVVTLVVPSGLRAERPDAVSAVEPLLAYLTTERLGRWNGRLIAGETLPVVAAAAAEELRALVPIPEPEAGPSGGPSGEPSPTP